MGLKFFIHCSSPFLKIGCISPIFRISGKNPVRKDKGNIWIKGIEINWTQHYTINSGTSSDTTDRELLSSFITHLTLFPQQSVRWTLTFFHVASIIFVLAPVNESMKTTHSSTAWCTRPSLPRRMSDVPALTDDFGAGKNTHLNDSKQCLGGGISDRYEMVLPDFCSIPTKTHAVPHSMLQIHLHVPKQLPSISTTLPTFPPPFPCPNPKISCMEKPKWTPILPCCRIATNQRQFAG